MRGLNMPLKKNKALQFLFLITLLITVQLSAQTRVGTTTANFLEIGFGTAGIAMGDAYTSVVTDLSAVYWNPAGIAFMKNNEAYFMVQPWVLDVSTSFIAVGIPVDNVGTFAFSLIYMGYGNIEVTTVDFQTGTGELYDANEYAISLSYGRTITEWFAFGATAKYVASQIWRVEGSAFALDMGVMIMTRFFSPSGKREDALRIGMSISNYGSKLKYDGTNLFNPIDILPDENGNYRDAPGQFNLSSWELPLLFRIGASIKPFANETNELTLAIDALHPNNNSESVNVGADYTYKFPTFGKFSLRAGYKGIFLESTEFGLTFGAGFKMLLFQNTSLSIDYSYRDLGILGSANCFGLGLEF